MLLLKTFGGLSVEIGGASATGAGQRRKTLALLAVLAAAGRRGVSRDKLTTYLWPESDTEHARNLLKQGCYALRRDLCAPDLFLGAAELRLNPEVITSDIGTFEDALARGDPARAVAVYAGPFLDGFYLGGAVEFERWVEETRVAITTRVCEVLESLARQSALTGDVHAAFKCWRRLTELDPFSAQAALGLMRTLDDIGERAEAVEHGLQFEAIVRKELGVEPAADVVALIHGLRLTTNPGTRTTARTHRITAPKSAPGEILVQRGRIPGRLVLAVALTAVAGVVVVAESGAPRSLDPNLVAVAPFDLLGRRSDSVWSEGLMRLLSVKLDGAGPLHTVPPTTVVQGWRGRADQVGGTILGLKVGAGLAVVGTVTEEGDDSMIVHATLVDVERAKPLQEVVARDAIRHFDRLADSVAIGLLQGLGSVRPIRAVKLSSIGSASLFALKAFLQGDQFYRRGEMDSAFRSYDRAVRGDPQFALAVNRRGRALSWTRGWFNESAEADLLAASRLNIGLGARDSLLLTAQSLGVEVGHLSRGDAGWWSLTQRLFDLLKIATVEYPKDPEFWYELGLARLFYEKSLGATYQDALDAFDRAIALDSAFAPAYLLPIELAFNLADSARALRYARAYVALQPTGPDAEATRLMLRLVDRTQATSAALTEALEAATPDMLMRLHNALHRWPDEMETDVRVARVLDSKNTPALNWPACGAPCRRESLARALSFRGHLREAQALVGISGALASDFILLGAIPADTIRVMGARHRPSADPPPLLGLLWLWSRKGDTAALMRYAKMVDSLARTERAGRRPGYWNYSSRVARAYLALGLRDTLSALQEFEALPDSLCGETCIISRLHRVQLLIAAGRHRDAYEQVREGQRLAFTPSAVLFALERGRVSEKLGERDLAARSYRFVLDVWVHADSTLHPYVAEARAALQRLGKER
jgi:eukaryotic-like serine/threonine-protein kinase